MFLDILYRTGLTAFLAFVFLTNPVSANEELPSLVEEEAPLLRSKVTVQSEYVTIGDLFENSGILAEKAIFRAPDLGKTGRVKALTVAAAARKAGLKTMDLNNVISVTVKRASRMVFESDVRAIIEAEIRDTYRVTGSSDLTVTLTDFPDVLYADPLTNNPLRIGRISYSRRNGYFDMTLIVNKGTGEDRLVLKGTAIETVKVAVLTRSLSRGEVVGDGDVILETVPRARARRTGASDPAALVGLAAKRPFRAGAQIAAADFTLPIIVPRNSIVSIVYKQKGMNLSVRGRSMADGAVGDTITVRNSQSKRTLQAIVEAPGLVVVGGGFNRIASLGGATQ